jgi:hypothetical protein
MYQRLNVNNSPMFGSKVGGKILFLFFVTFFFLRHIQWGRVHKELFKLNESEFDRDASFSSLTKFWEHASNAELVLVVDEESFECLAVHAI